jgi:two-component system chemotaxis response regulator CheY
MKVNALLQAEDSVSAEVQSCSNPHHRILVVEDAFDIRSLNAEVLINSGFQVDAAEDGAVAWDSLQLKSYDLVVTDNDMPKVSGVELLKKLRAAHMDLPVIMATGKLPNDAFTRYQWLHPAAMLLKPYTSTEFLETVREVLRATDGDRQRIAPSPHWQSEKPTHS